jgi:heptosyltransferase-2
MGNDTDQRGASLTDWLQYTAFRVAETGLQLMPLGLVARMGRMMGHLAYWVAGPYRKLAYDNLRIAFGSEINEQQRRALAREHFARLGGNLLCGFKLPLMKPADVAKRVTMTGLEHIREADSQGRNIVYAVCHLSCWELLTQVPSLFVFGRTPGSVYQPLANPLLNRLLLRRRQKLGYRLFDRSEGFAEPMKFVKERGCLGILVDQHAGDHGVWCPFFGRLASTTPLAALMARRGNALLLPMSVHNDGPGRWKMQCLPPVAGVPGEKAPRVEQVTAQINLVVEQMVRADPADWFWVHNRWKTPQPNFLLSHYRRGIAMPNGIVPGDLKPFELIVRSPNWLGDACMAFPAVRAFKRSRPDLRLTVFGPEKLRDLWLSLPEVDAYVGKGHRQGLWAVARSLRNADHHYDAGVLFTNSTRSTLEFWLAGIPRRVGYKGSLRSRMLNQICPEPKAGSPPLHHAHKYLQLAAHAGGDVLTQGLWPSRTARTGGQGGGYRIGLCAGAEYGPAKRWPLERFAEVANQVSTQLARPVEWFFFGAPGETAMGEELAKRVNAPHQNRVGKTTLSELIKELQTCHLLVTNDTGTMHLAASLGIATVSIFGSTEPSLTGPLGDQHRIVRHHVPCSPCFKRECPFGHYQCLNGVSVEQVSAEVLDVIRGL